MPKRGALSNDDRAFLLKFGSTYSVDEIAKRLDRSPDMVSRFLRRNVFINGASPPKQKTVVIEEKQPIRAELRASERWKRLKKELTDEEIKFFEDELIKTLGQFRGNVLHTEEAQIFDVLKYEVLMSRNMEERAKARRDISRLEKIESSFFSRFNGDVSLMTDADREQAMELATHLTASRAGEQSRTKEYVDLQQRKDALWRNLKATRDQRVNKIEGKDIDFLGVIKMLSERDKQESEGRMMGLSRMAAEKQYNELGKPIIFDDGGQDHPILSADTVNLGPDDTNEDQ